MTTSIDCSVHSDGQVDGPQGAASCIVLFKNELVDNTCGRTHRRPHRTFASCEMHEMVVDRTIMKDNYKAYLAEYVRQIVLVVACSRFMFIAYSNNHISIRSPGRTPYSTRVTW